MQCIEWTGPFNHRGYGTVTAAQIAEIRMRRATGERGIDLAAEFGVTPQNISSIYRGHTWAVSNG